MPEHEGHRLDPVDVLGDPELAAFLGRILRERPDAIAALRDIAPEADVREGDLDALGAAGLIRYQDGRIAALAPSATITAALAGVLAEHDATLARARTLLAALPELDRRWEEGAARLVRGIEGHVIVGAMAATEYWARILTDDPPQDAGSVFPSFESMRSFLTPVLEHLAAMIERGELDALPQLPFRFLLNSAELDDPDYRAMLDQLVAGGAQVRLLPAVPLFLYVERGRRAAIPLTRDSSAPGGGIFFENAATVESFSTLFEGWWAEAKPYPFAAEGWELVLELMATGLNDKQIAATLGVGLRTVHRRLAQAMDELGVYSRFELGAAWERRRR